MAATVTQLNRGPSKYAVFSMTLTSDAGGDAESDVFGPVSGNVAKVRVAPVSGSTPTTLWDLTLLDDSGDGADVLDGAGADQHASNPANITAATEDFFKGSLYGDSLKVVGANMGDTKSVEVLVYILQK